MSSWRRKYVESFIIAPFQIQDNSGVPHLNYECVGNFIAFLRLSASARCQGIRPATAHLVACQDGPYRPEEQFVTVERVHSDIALLIE